MRMRRPCRNVKLIRWNIKELHARMSKVMNPFKIRVARQHDTCIEDWKSYIQIVSWMEMWGESPEKKYLPCAWTEQIYEPSGDHFMYDSDHFVLAWISSCLNQLTSVVSLFVIKYWSLESCNQLLIDSPSFKVESSTWFTSPSSGITGSLRASWMSDTWLTRSVCVLSSWYLSTLYGKKLVVYN